MGKQRNDDGNSGCITLGIIIIAIYSIVAVYQFTYVTFGAVMTNVLYFLFVAGIIISFLFAKNNKKIKIVSIIIICDIVLNVIAGFGESVTLGLISVCLGAALGVTSIILHLIKRNENKKYQKQLELQQELDKKNMEIRNQRNQELRELRDKYNSTLDGLEARMTELANLITRESENEYKTILSSERNEYIAFWANKFKEMNDGISCFRNSYRAPQLTCYPGKVPGEAAVESFVEFKNEVVREDGGIKRGEKGEQIVIDVLNEYGDRYTHIDNLVLNSDFANGKTAEIDTVIINDKAIFVIEIKNRGEGSSWKLKISKDGLWSIKNEKFSGDTSEQWKSPVEQNIRHKIVLEETLKKAFKCDRLEYEIVPIIVFANNDIAIDNHSNNIVIRACELINYIETYPGNICISVETKNEIYDILNSNNMYDKKTIRIKDYEKLYIKWMELFTMQKEAVEVCKDISMQYLEKYKEPLNLLNKI